MRIVGSLAFAILALVAWQMGAPNWAIGITIGGSGFLLLGELYG